MKQYITLKQLRGLDIVQRYKLFEWMALKGYGKQIKEDITSTQDHWQVELLSIGQMIEFLIDQKIDMFYKSESHLNELSWPTSQELCDSLWVAVKENLNEKSV